MEDLKKCLNCGKTLKTKDSFCSNCGQKCLSSKISTREFLKESFIAIFSLDGRTWRTFRDIWIPGKIPLTYFSGKRKYYSNPFRTLVISIFFIIIVSGVSNIFSNLNSDLSFKEKLEDEFHIHEILDQNTLFLLDSARIKNNDTSLSNLELIQTYAKNLEYEPSLRIHSQVHSQTDSIKSQKGSGFSETVRDSLTTPISDTIENMPTLSQLSKSELGTYKTEQLPFEYSYFLTGYDDSLKPA